MEGLLGAGLDHPDLKEYILEEFEESNYRNLRDFRVIVLLPYTAWAPPNSKQIFR